MAGGEKDSEEDAGKGLKKSPDAAREKHSEKDSRRDSEEGMCRGYCGFLEILADMDEKKENERTISGSVEGPFFSKAVYSCVVRIGWER